MSPRAYRLGKREGVIEETRERIIGAATALFSEGAIYGVTLDEVAKRAGVSRATVYKQFESKAGLLDAVIAAAVQRLGVERVRKAREHADAAIGVTLYVKEMSAFWGREAQLMRNIYGLAFLDTGARDVVERWDARRRELLMWLVKRLEDQGRLRLGVSAKQALDVLWMLTSFASFDQMHARSGLSGRASAAALSEMATQAVIAPAATA